MLRVWIALTLVGGLVAVGDDGGDAVPDVVATSGLRASTVESQAPSSRPAPPAVVPLVTTTTAGSGSIASPPTTSPSIAAPQPGSEPRAQDAIVVEGPRYGDPNAEMPPEWVELCIPGTWMPEYRSCTFKPSRLTGTVRDHAGRPVSGMCIGALMMRWSRSDAAGSWTADVRGFASVNALVWDCGSGSTFGFQSQEVAATFQVDSTTNIDVVVIPFGGVRGRVIDSDGRPVPGACVASGGRQELSPVGPTGPDGRFELGGVAPGAHQVFLTPCPGADTMNMLELAPQTVPSQPGTWTDVDLAVILAA